MASVLPTAAVGSVASAVSLSSNSSSQPAAGSTGSAAPDIPTTGSVETTSSTADSVTLNLPAAPETSSSATQQLHRGDSDDPQQLTSLQSNLESYRSYRDALGSSSKPNETILYCSECSYPFQVKEELDNHI